MFLVVVAVRRVGMMESSWRRAQRLGGDDEAADRDRRGGGSRRTAPCWLGPVATSTCFAVTVPRGVVTRCAAPLQALAAR